MSSSRTNSLACALENTMDKNGNDVRLSKGAVKSIGHEFSDRITGEAVLRVIDEEEYRMRKVFQLASMVASHAGRETVKEDDVRMVYTFIEEVGGL